MFKIAAYPLVKRGICRMGINHLRNFATAKRSTGHFVDPKNDLAFKKLFGEESNKPILLNFLNSILRRKDDDVIEEVEILRQELSPRREYAKQSFLDVYCRDQKGKRYLVEMQNKKLGSFIQRMEYYASRVYTDQLVAAEGYDTLNSVLLLAIADHNVFPEEVECISYHHNREEKTNKCLLPNISYAFVELKKFNKCSEQLETPEDYWIHLLKEAPYENEPPKEAPSEVQEAYGVLERHTWTATEIAQYDSIMMEALDEKDAHKTAFSDGGDSRAKEIARRLLEDGLSPEKISDITDLSISEVNELK